MSSLLKRLGLDDPSATEIAAREAILQADEEAVQTASFNQAEVHELARTQLDFLAALSMPTIFRYCFPPVFIAAWDLLLQLVTQVRAFPKLALGLPRGFGKTTFVKLFVLFCILFTKKKFILITSATGPLAENVLADIMGFLDEPNIKAVFGDWRAGVIKETQNLKRFGFRGRDVILVALGAGGSIRGLNLGNDRPDIMIFEDIQTRECADSKVQSDALERWMFGTAMKAKAPDGCMYLFIGNMYPTEHSILRKLKRNPKWIKFIAGGILADGSSLWEELQPIAQLVDEYENDRAAGHPEIFHAEVLNDENASANNLIDLSNLPSAAHLLDAVPAGRFIVIDPSNDKANSDAVSLGYFEVHDAIPLAKEIIEGRFSPGETIKLAIQLGLKHNCRVICIESNAYQYSLLYWFNYIVKELGIVGFHALDIYSGALSKNTRILNMFKQLAKGEVLVAPTALPSVSSQVLAFNPLRRDNVDGVLDLLTYAPRVIDVYGPFIISLNELVLEDIGAIKVLEAYETSPF